MASRHRDAYLRVMNLLFETYSRQMEPMLKHRLPKALPIEQLEVRDPTTGKALTYADAKNDERLRRWAETAYRATVRAHACDVLRSYLPAATLTNVGMFGVGQAFEYLIGKFYSHELTEANGARQRDARRAKSAHPVVRQTRASEMKSHRHDVRRREH